MHSVQYDREANRTLHFTSFYLVDPHPPADVNGLYRASHLSRFRAVVLTPIQEKESPEQI
jgi:hypothetical protein